MKRSAVLLATVVALAACSPSNNVDSSTTTPEPTPTQPSGETTTTTDAPVEGTTTTIAATDRIITVVVDEIRAVALAATADRFTTETGVGVVFDVRDLDEIGPRSTDADVDAFMGPHTWSDTVTGIAAGSIAGVDVDSFVPVAIGAFATDSGPAAVPFSAESLVLFVNDELLERVPDDLEDGCGEVEADCLVMPGLGAAGGFHLTPFLMAGAGDATFSDHLRAFPDGTPALDALRSLVATGTLRLASVTDARRSFLDGEVAMFIGGPWDLGPIEDAGFSFSVAPLPAAGGMTLAAPVSVQGFYLSDSAPEQDVAREFLVEYVAAGETQLDLQLRDQRAPVHREVLAAADDTTAAFAAGVDAGFLLPADFADYGTELGVALQEIADGANPVAAVRGAIERIVG